jgi:hypothetical protein
MESTANKVQALYPPSWVDRLVEWIDSLRGPYWLFYALATIIMAVIINAMLWMGGGLPAGEVDIVNSSYAVFVFYYLGLYHYLTHVASRALRVYRPLLDVDDTAVQRLDHELTRLPRWIGRLGVPVGFVLAGLSVIGDPTYGGDVQPTFLLYAGDILITGFLMATFLAVIIRTIRQLVMVNRLQKRATNINLLRLAPAHAFSALTARTGIGIIIASVGAYIMELMSNGYVNDVISYVFLSLLALAAFVLPVIGIKNRIDEEKERALGEVTDLLQATNERLHEMVRNSEDKGLKRVEKATAALIRERELLKKVPTWPWDTATIRGFSSALLLPIFLWIVTRLLERVL